MRHTAGWELRLGGVMLILCSIVFWVSNNITVGGPMLNGGYVQTLIGVR
jgi:hypothetical protein